MAQQSRIKRAKGTKSVVLDDRSLRSVLLDSQSPRLKKAIRGASVYTTGVWLYRLSQAVRSEASGSLSGPIASLPDDLQSQIVGQLVTLPLEIAVLSGRELAWTMAGLIQNHRLNYLSLEALATLIVTGGTLVLSEFAESPLLVKACQSENVKIIFVE